MGWPCPANASETPTGLGSQRNQERLPHFETFAVAGPSFVHVAISGRIHNQL